ncbi:MAG: sec-independent protein translocase protein [Candidatus Saccharibacteria bacterium]|nr:sec-independent protein translocase protein [Candidatus Saccharibacteria bacterium]
MIELIDTHCHLQFADYPLDPEQTLVDAQKDGVVAVIAVGCTLEDSKEAVKFAAKYDNVWAAIGLHPHEAKVYVHNHKALQEFHELAKAPKVVAIGETGLDFYYNHSDRDQQEQMLRFQLDMAVEHNLPVIFHVREAFDEFWPIFDQYSGLTGVIHSFSSNIADLEQILSRELYVGLNGIMTFTKRSEQLEAAKCVPLDKLLLETDAPFLTPAPFRGKMGESKYVRVTGEFLSKLRGETLETLANATTANARKLFKL